MYRGTILRVKHVTLLSSHKMLPYILRSAGYIYVLDSYYALFYQSYIIFIFHIIAGSPSVVSEINFVIPVSQYNVTMF